MNAAFHISLLTFFGAVGAFLTDPTAGYGDLASSGSQLVQGVLTVAGALSIWLIATSRDGPALLRKCAPIFFLCALAIASTVWSVDKWLTFRRSIMFTISILLGLGLVSRLGTEGSVKLLIRSMSFTCFVSVIAVFVWPSFAIHQADDLNQIVHAGLWRGLLGHKVALGAFAGLTLALIAFYGFSSFSNPASAIIASGSALACLNGSGSATGLVAGATLFLMLLASRMVLSRPITIRAPTLGAVTLGFGFCAALLFSGTIDRFAAYLGRSDDLTGRTAYWPYVQAIVDQQGPLLGFGYGAGFRLVGTLAAELSGTDLGEAHNGYLEMIVAFGYIGLPVVLFVYGLFFLSSRRLLLLDVGRMAPYAALPFSFLVTQVLTSHVESIVLPYNGVWAILFSVSLAAVGQLSIEHDSQVAARSNAAMSNIRKPASTTPLRLAKA